MNWILNIAYVALFGIWCLSYFYAIDMSVNVITTATLIVFIGSHRSLRLLATEAEGGMAASEKEVLSTKDAAQFPVVGSCALFGLFLAFKYLDKELVNVILSGYFLFVGIFTLTGTLSPVMEMIIPAKEKYGFKTSIPLLGDLDARFNIAELISMIPATIFSYFYVKSKHYMMNNILGIAFCVQSLERISIGSYNIGAILLIGLFFYDIFWVFGSESVFGSNVMVTVAKNFDGPIKLLFPKSLPGTNIMDGISKTIANTGNSTLIGQTATSACKTFIKSVGTMLKNDKSGGSYDAAANMLTYARNTTLIPSDCNSIVNIVTSPLKSSVDGEFSLLGLGDIVIPGLFVAILLRFDAVQSAMKGTQIEHLSFPKPFFYANIIAYALGLGVTMFVMLIFKAAQPALLYLVPACLGGSILVGAIKGNFSKLLEYNEEQAEEDKKEGDNVKSVEAKKTE
jgi:hypothetical protein